MNEMSGKQGFTLIEVVVTIIIAALAGIVIFAYLGNVLTRSHESIGQVRDLAEAVGVMEGVVARYSNEYLSNPTSIDLDCAWLQNVTIPDGVDVKCNDDAVPSPNFDIFLITITKKNQTIAALFTE